MNIMIDLETLGTSPDSAILSIGLVSFDKSGIKDRLEVFCDIDTQRDRRSNHGTLEWWLSQSEEARKAIAQGMKNALPLQRALLLDVKLFIQDAGENVKVWGNGSDFDNAILAHAHASHNITLPWKFWNNRCYRTIKSLFRDVPESARSGVYHSAVDDAEHQANHLIKIAEVHKNVGIL